MVYVQPHCNFHVFYAATLQFLWFLCNHPPISMVLMQPLCNFHVFYVTTLQFLWFLWNHSAISMFSVQPLCNFYGFYANTLQFPCFLCNHSAISMVSMQSSWLDLPVYVPVCNEQEISAFPQKLPVLNYSFSVLWCCVTRDFNREWSKAATGKIKSLCRWLFEIPLDPDCLYADTCKTVSCVFIYTWSYTAVRAVCVLTTIWGFITNIRCFEKQKLSWHA